ncbi:MAG: HD domain-containing protein [Armatimonadota bacterium]|nr:HD domain-containing protein [Armatimonadota bacterium]
MAGEEPAQKRTRLNGVLRLAESCGFEAGHTFQVTRLALRLFDELRSWHRLGEPERFWLECAGLLHDIGWMEGQAGHHKASLRAILGSSLLPFDARERYVVGSIARYHRKALPSPKHPHFAALAPADREVVRVLAAILRVADGLDRSHQSLVQDLVCELSPNLLTIRCRVRGFAEVERETALKKGDLLRSVLGREVRIVCERD